MERCTILEVKEGIATLTLHRPEVLNAINEQMVAEMNEALDIIEQDVNIRVLLITGKGKSFCVGADTKVFLQKSDAEGQQFLDSILTLFQRFEEIDIPVIAAINGFAFGGGAQLSIACDIRIASESASFRFPGASYGLVISGHLLPSIVGISKAKELLFSSKIITSEEALRIGLVNQLTPLGEEFVVAFELAEMICNNPDRVVRKIKKVINGSVGRTMQECLELEHQANQELIKSSEFRTTFASFVSEIKARKNSSG
jgi:enoyl-CoA hydratase